MEITGKIIAVLEEKSGISGGTLNTWRCAQYVIETQEAFPKRMFFEVFGDLNINLFEIKKDDVLTVYFYVDAKEYHGRWYNQFRAYNVEKHNYFPQTKNKAEESLHLSNTIIQVNLFFDTLRKKGIQDKMCASIMLSILILMKLVHEVSQNPYNYINGNKILNSYTTISWDNLKLLSPDEIYSNIRDIIYHHNSQIQFPIFDSSVLPDLIRIVETIKILKEEDIDEIYETICLNIKTTSDIHFFYEFIQKMKHLLSYDYTIEEEGVDDGNGALYSKDEKYLIKGPNIKEYKIKDGTLYLANNCFYANSDLEKVTMPKTIKAIGQYAFYLCHNLKEVIIDENVNYIGSGVFNSCENLKLTLKNNFYKCNGDSLLSIDGKNFLSYWGTTKEVIIPEGVTRLSSGSLRNAKNALSIKLPKTLMSIQVDALMGFKGNSLYIPSQVRFVGGMAFGFSKHLQYISFPGDCYINSSALHKCERMIAIYLQGRNTILDPNIIHYRPFTSIIVQKEDEDHYRKLLSPTFSSLIKTTTAPPLYTSNNQESY